MKTMSRMLVILALLVAGGAISGYAQDKPKPKDKKEQKEKHHDHEKKDAKKDKKKS